MHEATCEQCGTRFQASRSHARFCSARCRMRWHRQEREPQPKPSRIGVTVAPIGWYVEARVANEDRAAIEAALDDFFDCHGEFAGRFDLRPTTPHTMTILIDLDQRAAALEVARVLEPFAL